MDTDEDYQLTSEEREIVSAACLRIRRRRHPELIWSMHPLDETLLHPDVVERVPPSNARG